MKEFLAGAGWWLVFDVWPAIAIAGFAIAMVAWAHWPKRGHNRR